jgi:hypothetical protein
MTGCVLQDVETFVGDERQLMLAIHASPSTSVSQIRVAIETVEDMLIRVVIGSEPSRGKFLYEMALCYGEVKSDGSVQQRSPFNSSERVWMNVIDIGTEHNNFVIDGKMNDDMHAAKALLCICKVNFGSHLRRCKPYVLVTSKQAKNVALATAAVKNAMKRHSQSRVGLEFTSTSKPTHTFILKPTQQVKVPKSNSFKSRKIMFPLWAMSDETFKQQVHGELFYFSRLFFHFQNAHHSSNICVDTLFQSDTCAQVQIRESGCDVMSTSNGLLVRTMPLGIAISSPNINKATDIIENTLLDLLGAEESRSRFLYDLTES